MATTTALFKVRFPEFSSADDARIQLFLDDAAADMSEVSWGSDFDRGQSYLAAHYLSIAESSVVGSSKTVSGPITGRTVDGVSVSYGGNPSTSSDSGKSFYESTVYGQMYYKMMKDLGVAALVV